MEKQSREEIVKKLAEINSKFKEDWDKNNDNCSAACYKALNVVMSVIQYEKDDDYDRYYVASRLVEVVSFLGDFFKTDFRTKVIYYLNITK